MLLEFLAVIVVCAFGKIRLAVESEAAAPTLLGPREIYLHAALGKSVQGHIRTRVLGANELLVYRILYLYLSM